MNKKLIKLLIIVFLLAAIIGAAAITTPKWLPKFGKESKSHSDQQTESDSLNVDEKLLTIDITLPKEFHEDGDLSPEISEEEKESGVKAKKINDDGSVTYTYLKSKWKENMKEYKSSVEKSLNDLANGTEYPSIKQIKFKNDFREITVLVNKDEWESGYDSFACLGIYMNVAFYQYLGQQELGCVITVVDEATNETISESVYPQDEE